MQEAPGWGAAMIGALALVGCAAQGASPSTSTAKPAATATTSISATPGTSAIAVTGRCNAEFAKASSVDPMLDTVSDLYPAVRVCISLDDWVGASRANPGAISAGVEPLEVLSNICYSESAGLSATSLCKLAKKACKTNEVLAQTVMCILDQ
jgi:hypothetical protein